jgi:hypothetical protein
MKELVLGMLFAVGLARAEHPSIKRHERPLSDDVVISLSSDALECSVFEPLALRVNLRNLGREPAIGYFSLDPAFGWLKIYYRRPRGELHQLEYPALKLGLLQRVALKLGPGEDYSYPLTHAFDPIAHRFVFDEPGEYALNVVYEDIRGDPNGVLESGFLTVQVLAAPKAEQAALRDYSQEKIGLLLQFTGFRYSIGREGVGAARTFLDEHPDSLYATHVKAGLERILRLAIADGSATAEEKDLFKRVREPVPRSVGVVTQP